jgi:hypothetical protein
LKRLDSDGNNQWSMLTGDGTDYKIMSRAHFHPNGSRISSRDLRSVLNWYFDQRR